jgi:hypothetical protein
LVAREGALGWRYWLTGAIRCVGVSDACRTDARKSDRQKPRQSLRNTRRAAVPHEAGQVFDLPFEAKAVQARCHGHAFTLCIWKTSLKNAPTDELTAAPASAWCLTDIPTPPAAG